MHFVTYNIQHGLGHDGRLDLARIARTVASADVIALQEVDRHWPRSGMIDQAAALAALLPEHHWVYGPGVDLDASERHQGRLVTRRRQFGNMLLSRTPILSSRNHLLPNYATAKNISIQRSILEGVIDTPSGLLRVYSIHLSHLAPELRQIEIAVLMTLYRRAVEEGGVLCGEPDKLKNWLDTPLPPAPRRAVLLGDFNLPPQDAEYAALVGPASRYGRLQLGDVLVDAWTAAGHAENEGTTNKRGRLDYCFISRELTRQVQHAWIDNTADGSDHQPLWVELDLSVPR